MESLIKPEEEQKETPAKAATRDAVPQNKNVSASTDRESSGLADAARKDPRAAQKLARKKRMKTAHRRRLKASYANG